MSKEPNPKDIKYGLIVIDPMIKEGCVIQKVNKK
jgi:hypothetical protein